MGSVQITTLDRTVIGEEPFAGDAQSTHIGPVDRIGSMVDLDTVRRTSRRGDGTYLAVIRIERKNRSGTDQKDVDFASHRSGPSITLSWLRRVVRGEPGTDEKVRDQPRIARRTT